MRDQDTDVERTWVGMLRRFPISKLVVMGQQRLTTSQEVVQRRHRHRVILTMLSSEQLR